MQYLAPTWFNPRRRRHAERLIAYMQWHGHKLYLDAEHYSRLRAEEFVEPYQVDAACDDLFALGAVDITCSSGKVIITLLVASLDELPIGPVFHGDRHSPGFRPAHFDAATIALAGETTVTTTRPRITTRVIGGAA